MDTTQITKRGRLFAGLFLLVIVGFASQTQAVQHLNTGSMMGKKMSTQSSVHGINNNQHGARKTLFGQLEAIQMDKDKLVQVKQVDQPTISVSEGETPSIHSDSTQALDAGVVIPVTLDTSVIAAPAQTPYESVSTSAEAPPEVIPTGVSAETSSTETLDLKAENLQIQDPQVISADSLITNSIPDSVIESAATAILESNGAIKDQILKSHKGLKEMFDGYNEDEVFGDQIDLRGDYQDTLDQQIQQKLDKRKAGSLDSALPLDNLFNKIEQEGLNLRSADLESLFIKAPHDDGHFPGANTDDEYDYVEEDEVVEDEGGVAQEPPKAEQKPDSISAATADAPK